MSHFVLSPPSTVRGLPRCWTIYKVEGTAHTSFLYLRKPRNVDQKEFDEFMRHISIHGPQETP